MLYLYLITAPLKRYRYGAEDYDEFPTPEQPLPPLPDKLPVKNLLNEQEFIYMLRARACPGCSMSFKDKQAVLAHIGLAQWDQFGGGEERPKLANPLPIQLVKKIFDDTYRLYDVDLSDVEV